MEKFETVLEEATKKGSNIVPGAVAAVVDKDGNYIYKVAKGFNGVTEDAKPIEFDQTYFVASCTKLIGSIAGLQAVERGLVTLDEPLDEILPELASQPILAAKGDSEFELHPATKSITLRHLLSHSSGAVYDLMHPTLIAWRQSRGETPDFPTSGVTAKEYAYPRAFEAGEGWMYGPGIDWVSTLVARLNKTGFEEYVEKNISEPLGIKSFTWHLSRKPDVEKKLMRMSERADDGTLIDGKTPLWPEPVEEAGGAGLYTNVHDYTRVLADLLKESPSLLKKATVDEMFKPQFGEGSASLKAMYDNAAWTTKPTLDNSLENVTFNHGLGGFVVVEDIRRENYYKPKGTLSWSGMPNLLWSVNRERGLAFFFATQVIPWADPKAQSIGARFETAVWENLSK